MFGKADTSTVFGIDAEKVVVEADFGDGLPSFDMVGFLGSEVKEAKERVRSALKNTGITVQPGRLTVNLSPADLRKQGNSFDLPIAVSILVSIGVLPQESVDPYSFFGELSLDGQVRPIHGTLSHVILARESRKKGAVVPFENAAEAAVFQDFPVYGVRTLSELVAFLLDTSSLTRVESPEEADPPVVSRPDFSDVFGQESVKRAAAVASAGMHGFLMIGPPGSGKTLTARRIPTIMPPLTEAERIECTKIHSVAGILPPGAGLMTERPYRAPHHTVSANALVGGGSFPKPGEMSLAHNGVLFLDELPEFNKSTLEVMRQPLEDRKVVISRVHGSYVFPTRVMLVLAMNPCRCGYYPDRNKCRCSEAEVHAYLSRISRPLLDRVDILKEVPRVPAESLGGTPNGLSSEDLRKQVIAAWNIQKERYRNDGILFNSELEGKLLRKYCALDTTGRALLKDAFEKLNLSARAHDRILKVARTIADLSGGDRITEAHLLEAISYRTAGEKFWRGI